MTKRAKAAKAGLKAAKLRGVKIGRPLSKDRAKMKKLRGQGKTFRHIAAKLKCSTATIWRAMSEAT